MFKRHEIQVLRRAGHTLADVARLSGASVGTVRRVVEEIAHRQQTRLSRLVRRAHFPFLKTIDDFNFTYQTTLRLTMLGSALSPDFVTDGRSLIFAGKRGRGKTHLAIAVAYRAIQNGFDAFFTTAATFRTLHVNLDDALETGSNPEDEVIRISGSQRSEFPEPTHGGADGPDGRTRSLLPTI